MRKSRYTDEEIIAAAKLCSTRFEFIRQYKNLYEAARYRGLLQKIFEWLPASDQNYTPKKIIETAKQFGTRTAWQKAYQGQYRAAVRLGIMPQIHAMIPAAPHGEKAYTEAELAAEAKKFETRADWQAAGEKIRAQGGVSPYMCALGCGPEFFKKHCAHMEQRHRWTDDELIASAAKYTHKGDWKRSSDAKDRAAYQAAQARPDIFAKVTAHMVPKANPYSGSYVVYVFEFQDHCAYIGLTFREEVRKAENLCRGPVFQHMKICADYRYKCLAEGIASPFDVGNIERDWQGKYAADGWTPLWTAKAGGLGTVRIKEWTKEIVLQEAKKYATRKAWAVGSRQTYNIAKAEGWFDEAAAHMPKRVLGIGVGRKVSRATRRKQRLAKLGTTLDRSHRAAISASIKQWWATDQKRT